MNTEKKYVLTSEDIFILVKEAYRHGFSTCEMVEAGLEGYDAEGYAAWIVRSLNSKQIPVI
jgi:hypothetical protein